MKIAKHVSVGMTAADLAELDALRAIQIYPPTRSEMARALIIEGLAAHPVPRRTDDAKHEGT